MQVNGKLVSWINNGNRLNFRLMNLNRANVCRKNHLKPNTAVKQDYFILPNAKKSKTVHMTSQMSRII